MNNVSTLWDYGPTAVQRYVAKRGTNVGEASVILYGYDIYEAMSHEINAMLGMFFVALYVKSFRVILDNQLYLVVLNQCRYHPWW